MDAILRAQGMIQGTFAERMAALSKDPARFFSDDARARDALIGYCNDRVDAIRKLMPAMSHLDLKAALVVKRVPPDIETGAPLGYMSPAPLDGSQPAIYYNNLKSTRLWAKHALTSLTAHEGIPGHAWQFAYQAERSGKQPLIDSLIGFNAFIEGWALYAEQLCEEAGLSATDPFSQLGYLGAQQFRACRLVIDTGLHAMHWTRQQAVRYMGDNTGRSTAAMTNAVDRYTVSPGQACGCKMGHNEILQLRQQARLALGMRFDVAAFNDPLVKSTGAQLTLLAGMVDQFVVTARKG